MSDQSSNINTAGTGSDATTTSSAPAAPGAASMAPSASASAGATQTVTITEEPATQTSNNEVLRLTLQDRRGVRWYVCFDLKYRDAIRWIGATITLFEALQRNSMILIVGSPNLIFLFAFSIQTGRKGL